MKSLLTRFLMNENIRKYWINPPKRKNSLLNTYYNSSNFNEFGNKYYLLKKEFIRSNFAYHKSQVSSYGGGGTTMLLRFLSNIGQSLPFVAGRDWSPWKHMPYPHPDENVRSDFKAIYLFDDPRISTIAVFRRNFQNYHVQRVDRDLKMWDNTMSLEKFINLEKDLFKLEDHFDNWTTNKRSYPILVVNYNNLWDDIDTILDYVGVDKDLAKLFPTKTERSSNLSTLEPKLVTQLSRTYTNLLEKQKDFSKTRILY